MTNVIFYTKVKFEKLKFPTRFYAYPNILRAGHARLACQVNGAVMPSATGTHRSDSSIAA
jgi:hypothetical protein